ncbi:MAG: CelD-like protein, partial [Sphingobium sp.]
MGQAALTVTFEPLPDLAALELRWRGVEARAAPNFFTGWTWMGSWLRATGARPELLAVRDGDEEIALALIGRSFDRRLLGRAATLRLNEAGDAAADRAFIEYNAPLCRAGQEAAAARA